MKEKRYLFIAIIVSPFLGTIISNILIALINYPSSTKDLFDILLESIVPALYGGLFLGLPTILFAGIPVYLLLSKINTNTPWIYAVVGFIVSMLLLMLTLTKNTQSLNSSDMPAVIMFGLHGISVALVFWYFAILLRERNQNDSNKRLWRQAP